MAKFTKGHSLLLPILLLACSVILINCGQESSKSASPSPTPNPTPTPTPQPTICASCITLGDPSLKKLDESTNGGRYQLSFVITNNGDVTLSNFEVHLKVEAQTATTQQSSTQTLTNSSTTVSGHSQFTYQVGDPNISTSGITLPNPPPSTAHITVSIVSNGTTLANWDGQVNVPA